MRVSSAPRATLSFPRHSLSVCVYALCTLGCVCRVFISKGTVPRGLDQRAPNGRLPGHPPSVTVRCRSNCQKTKQLNPYTSVLGLFYVILGLLYVITTSLLGLYRSFLLLYVQNEQATKA